MRTILIGLTVLIALPGLAWAQPRPGNCAEYRTPPDQAIASCTRLLQSGAETPAELVVDYDNRALAYLKKGMNDEAIADENRSLAIDERSSNGHINRGGAYAHKGEFDRAIADYTRAIELPADTTTANLNADGHALAYNDRGAAYGERGRYPQAMADFDRAIALSPRFVDPYNNRALINERVGSRDKAAADYRFALKLDPHNAKALAGLARLGLKP